MQKAMRISIIAVAVGLSGCAASDGYRDDNRDIAPESGINDNETGLFETALAHSDKGEHKKAYELYRQAAELGDAASQFMLASSYENHQGVSQDYSAAAAWYRRSAEQGYLLAQRNLGRMYKSGRGVSQNDSKAIELFRLAADQGQAGAQKDMGDMYYYGRGIPQNHSEAIKWYLLAAEQGNASAPVSYTHLTLPTICSV